MENLIFQKHILKISAKDYGLKFYLEVSSLLTIKFILLPIPLPTLLMKQKIILKKPPLIIFEIFQARKIVQEKYGWLQEYIEIVPNSLLPHHRVMAATG